MMSGKQESKEDYSTLSPVNQTPRDVRDIAELAIPVDEFYVAEWTETKKSRPSQVHIVLTVGKESKEASVAIALRLKSKRATSELIKALQRHRDAVWP